uniref:Uncharacterized protein n=1 Tax=Ascaris lumbricoides TaxID=6252 RepID=A0A0M3IMK4_ASCLU
MMNARKDFMIYALKWCIIAEKNPFINLFNDSLLLHGQMLKGRISLPFDSIRKY